jgi:hypothetical protein
VTTYLVHSDNLLAGHAGSTISEEQLAGCNVEALISGGHISPVKATTPAKKAASKPTRKSKPTADAATEPKE